MIAWIQAHALQIFFGYYILSGAISALPAPTADSTKLYQWFFKFSNWLAANLARAYSTSIESSPNFRAAVAIANQQNQVLEPPVQQQAMKGNPNP